MIPMIVDNRRSVDEVWLLLLKNTMHPINNLRRLMQLPIGRIQKDQLLDAHELCRLAALTLPGLAQIAPPAFEFLSGNPLLPQLRTAPQPIRQKNMCDGCPRLPMERDCPARTNHLIIHMRGKNNDRWLGKHSDELW